MDDDNLFSALLRRKFGVKLNSFSLFLSSMKYQRISMKISEHQKRLEQNGQQKNMNIEIIEFFDPIFSLVRLLLIEGFGWGSRTRTCE